MPPVSAHQIHVVTQCPSRPDSGYLQICPPCSQPHGAQQIHRRSLAPPLASFNVPCPTSLPFPPHHPANPHPSEPRLFSAAYPGCQSTPNHILLCSSPAADPTRTTHHAQDSGCLWESSHVSHWCIPVLSSNLPGLGPQLCPLWRSKGRGILHALWCSLRFINQHRQLNFKKSF